MPANLDPAQPVPESFSRAGMVFDWYRNLPSRRIDLFDDYAGDVLFLVEFDSLLLHCFLRRFLDVSDACFVMIHDGAVVGQLQFRGTNISQLETELDNILDIFRKLKSIQEPTPKHQLARPQAGFGSGL